MWFLIKGTFWFSMVLVLLSYFGTPEDKEMAEAPGIEIGTAVAAATGAYSYISSICVEKPDVCIKGAETLNALGQRAKAGAYVAYQILDEKLGDGSQAGTTTGTVGGQEGANAVAAALNATDTGSDAIFTGTVAASADDATGVEAGNGEPLVLHIPVPIRRPGN